MEEDKEDRARRKGIKKGERKGIKKGERKERRKERKERRKEGKKERKEKKEDIYYRNYIEKRRRDRMNGVWSPLINSILWSCINININI